MLNTSWDDDGENLNAQLRYGFAWAPSALERLADRAGRFRSADRRVLFGEPGDEFGRAIQDSFRRPILRDVEPGLWEAPTGLVRHDGQRRRKIA